MNERIAITDYQIFDVIYQVLLVLFSMVPIFTIDGLFENEILNNAIYYAVIVLIFGVIKLSKRISIYNGFVVKEVYSLLFGSIKTIEKFRISNIEEIFLNKNDELYFEITVKRKCGKNFIFKKLPNKNPALKDLELIKSYFRIV